MGPSNTTKAVTDSDLYSRDARFEFGVMSLVGYAAVQSSTPVGTSRCEPVSTQRLELTLPQQRRQNPPSTFPSWELTLKVSSLY
jgi:hypothetical protein